MVFSVVLIAVLMILMNFSVGAGIAIYSLKKYQRGEWEKWEAKSMELFAIAANGWSIIHVVITLVLFLCSL